MKLFIIYLIALFYTSVHLSHGSSEICADTSVDVARTGRVIVTGNTGSTGSRNCTLEVTGIAEYSWLQLRLTASSLDPNCNRNSISLDGYDDVICSATNNYQFSVFLKRSTTATVRFVANAANEKKYFTLQLTVARVIYTGSSMDQEVQISSNQQGYIVSHFDYSTTNYDNYINSKLTFKPVRPALFSVEFVSFKFNGDKCDDSLDVFIDDMVYGFCDESTAKGFNDLQNVTGNSSTFNFVTNADGNNRGFMLEYRITLTEVEPASSTSTESTTTSTHLSTQRTRTHPENSTPRRLSLKAAIGIGAGVGVIIIAAAVIAVVLVIRKHARKGGNPQPPHTEAAMTFNSASGGGDYDLAADYNSSSAGDYLYDTANSYTTVDMDEEGVGIKANSVNANLTRGRAYESIDPAALVLVPTDGGSLQMVDNDLYGT